MPKYGRFKVPCRGICSEQQVQDAETHFRCELFLHVAEVNDLLESSEEPLICSSSPPSERPKNTIFVILNSLDYFGLSEKSKTKT
jgi:hypothetical protein